MEYILYVLLFVLLIIFRKDIGKNPFSPRNLTILIWSVVMILYHFQDDLYPLTDTFFICLFLWLIGFLITNQKPKFDNPVFALERINKKVLICYFLIAVITVPLYCKAYLNAIGGFSINMFFDLRQSAVNGEVQLGIYSYVPPLCKGILFIELFRFSSKTKYSFILALLLNLLCALTIMEKGYLVLIFASCIFFMYQKNIITKRNIMIYSFLFLFFLVFFNSLRREDFSTREVGDTSSFISLYVVSPSVAFTQLTENSSQNFGINTFRFFYAVGKSLGLTNEVVSQWHEPVFVPVRTNVFTVMQPYFQDFGYIGVFIFSLINGFIMSYVYRKYKESGGVIYTCLYVYILHFLIIQFFQEGFFVSLSSTLQIFILISLVSFELKALKE